MHIYYSVVLISPLTHAKIIIFRIHNINTMHFKCWKFFEWFKSLYHAWVFIGIFLSFFKASIECQGTLIRRMVLDNDGDPIFFCFFFATCQCTNKYVTQLLCSGGPSCKQLDRKQTLIKNLSRWQFSFVITGRDMMLFLMTPGVIAALLSLARMRTAWLRRGSGEGSS